jgi:uncharacterized protein (TIGR02271 family)
MAKEPISNGAGGRPPSAYADASSTQEQTVVPVLNEELRVHTRRVETDAGVRISKTVDEREQTVDVPLVKELVDVERIAVNRPVDAPPSVRHEGDTTIIPIVEEVLFVEKRLVLKEEIRVTRRKTEVRDPQRVTLRAERAAVERMGNTQSDGSPRDPHDHSGDDAVRLSQPTDPADGLLERKRRQDDELRREVSRHSSRK